jgi:hypothetical protein
MILGLRTWCPRQDSNLRHRLRRAVLYPLSYGGPKLVQPSSAELLTSCRETRLHGDVRPLCRSAGAAFYIGGADRHRPSGNP